MHAIYYQSLVGMLARRMKFQENELSFHDLENNIWKEVNFTQELS